MLMIFTWSQKLKACYVDLKEQFTQKWKFSHYLLTLTPTEGRVYFVSPQNTAGVSQENSVAESPKQWKWMATSVKT